MTYSIVARDDETGRFGVAVATCMFAVGSAVPAARAGVGTVATQAMPDPSHRARALDLLAGGHSAEEVITVLQAADPGAPIRQTGLIDASGGSAAFTGDLCIDHAGHRSAPGYSVQANMMASPDVWPAMAETYEQATGPFEQRLLAALRAAEDAGGDARGAMSAAMVVVEAEPSGTPGGGVVLDVRVDDSPRPLDELARLLVTATAFSHFHRAVDALFSGDPERALAEADAAQRLVPDDGNVRFVRSGALALSGRTDDGLRELRALVRERPSWAVIVRSFAAKGLLSLPPDVDVEAILEG